MYFPCFFNFSVLIFHVVNTNRYNPHQETLFDVLNDFSKYKSVVKPKHLRTAGGDYF